MRKKVRISPSIIATDYKSEEGLNNALSILKRSRISLLHLDVMDGVFVPNITFGAEFVSKMRDKTDFILDTHLMIEHPEEHIDEYVKAGANILTVHYEATKNLEETLKNIRDAGLLAGVSIKLETPVEKLEKIITEDLVDVILVMSVEPGDSGRPFDERAIEKIRTLRGYSSKLDIEVDGGINAFNIEKVVEAGANLVVAGSSIFRSENPIEAIKSMKGYRCKL